MSVLRWPPNFSPGEFDCHDGTSVPDAMLADCKRLAWQLQALRDDLGKPVVVISGYRHPAYNKLKKGKPQSLHLQAKAADIKVRGMTGKQIRARIEKLIAAGKMEQGGLGTYEGEPMMCHYDVRGRKARWHT